jgi:hypothetical protein
MHESDDDTGAAMEMPRYVSHKTVWALEIESVSEWIDPTSNSPQMTRLITFREKGYAPSKLPKEMFSRYTPIPGDFYVVYADGYKSFSPRKAFLEGYTKAA